VLEVGLTAMPGPRCHSEKGIAMTSPSGTIVITTAADLESALGLDFTTACSELDEARFQHSCKDTPGNRATVTEAPARIDAVLDMYLDAVGRR
jgi:hypothetical protein